MVMDFMLSVGSGLDFSRTSTKFAPLCTILNYEKTDCCNKNFTVLHRKTEMDVKEGNI